MGIILAREGKKRAIREISKTIAIIIALSFYPFFWCFLYLCLCCHDFAFPKQFPRIVTQNIFISLHFNFNFVAFQFHNVNTIKTGFLSVDFVDGKLVH
jgi:hypothetical protein